MNEKQVVRELRKLDGVSQRMSEQLVKQGITSLEDLAKKLESGQLINRQLKLELEKLRSKRQQFSQRLALQIANPVISRLRSMQVVERVDYVGSLRREKLVVSNVNILFICKSESRSLVFRDIVCLGEVVQSESDRLILLRYDNELPILIEIRAVESQEWVSALFWYTGSLSFVSRLRALALKEGVVLSSHSIEKNGERVTCSNEEEIFQLINEEYISAYLRRA